MRKLEVHFEFRVFLSMKKYSVIFFTGIFIFSLVLQRSLMTLVPYALCFILRMGDFLIKTPHSMDLI